MSCVHGNATFEECRVIEEGQLVADRYRLLETIGSGAMGVVWRAKDERLGRIIAVKHLHVRTGLSEAQTDEARRRAMREARIAARLQHRNAIAMLDVAEQDGDPFLIMEFLASKSLSAVLAERGTLPPDQVAAIGSQVAAALAAAHAAGIVHRDVKPGNILLADEGTVKITDFGISRALGDATITETGMLAGTPAYLAPEIARGKDPSHASDVFSLGATLYHAIEGSPPFGLNPNPLALLHAVAKGHVDPPRNGGSLTPTLMSLLRSEPAHRPTMAEAATTLAAPTAPLPMADPDTVDLRDSRLPELRMSDLHARTAVGVRSLDPRTPQRPVGVRTGPRPDPRGSFVPVEATAPVRRVPTDRPAPPPRRGVPVLVWILAAVLVLGGVVTFIVVNSDKGGAGTVATQSSTTPPTTVSTTVAQAEKVTNYSAAGQKVIDYFGDATPDARWEMLGPNGKAAFADRAAFDAYWAKFQYVSSRQARVTGENPDGSVMVSVEVTGKASSGDDVRKRTVKVILVGGQYFIDSDSK
ncbi:serine/threonine-protein kinase [Alloactinosynnema sp. L-07]|uniref:serine/threonine-protein kinase n=1 Tax=Alloactinosynnema sp. L-07 TaxID=1653480 RepID=UPI000833E821|nr:serine/threonine-protein kinase [Alloactinosynnema sp. L-07]